MSLAALLVGVVLAVAITLRWASRSEAVLRWGIATFGARLPCELSMAGLTGSLSEPVRIQRLVCAGPTVRVEAADVALDWSPWALTRERLDVSRLEAATLTIEFTPADDAALSPPESLALPIAVHLETVAVGSLTLSRGARSISLQDLDASYDSDRQSHRLVLRELASQWGSVTGEAAIGAQAPLPLSARLKVSSTAISRWPLSGEIALSGELQRVQAKIAASAGELPLQAELTITAFSTDPLPQVTLRTGKIDLHRLVAAAPPTAIEAEFRGAARGLDALSGQLIARNAAYGTLDTDRLPVRALETQVRLTRTEIALQDATVSLGAAGTASGAARIDAEGIQVNLATERLDLHDVHTALHTTHLAGTIQLQVDSGRQLIRTDLRQDDLRVQARAVLADERLSLQQVMVQAGGATLRATGEVALAGSFAFAGDGRLDRFNPARFGDFPAAQVSGSIAAQGQLRPDWRVALRYRLGVSRLRGQALAGDGTLTLSAHRVQDADARLSLGGNSLALRGSFGRPEDQLEFRLVAPRLAALHTELAGGIAASGKLSGTPAHPAIDATLDARDLRYREYRVQRWTLAVQIEQADDPRLRVDSRLEHPARGDLMVDAIVLRATGTLSRHTLAAQVTGKRADLQARAEGVYDLRQGRWTGQLLSVADHGEFAFVLTQPTKLSVGADELSLGRTSLTFAGGELTLEDTRWADGELATTGSISGVPLAWLLRWYPVPRLQSTLILGGRWSLRGRDRLDGSIEVIRERGDLVIESDEQPLALGLSEMRLTATATAGRVSAQARLHASSFTAQASGETLLSQRDGRWGIAGDAPLSARGSATSTSIRPILALFSSTLTGDGKLALQLEGSGTIADPNLSGHIAGDQLRIEQVEAGVFLRDGTLRARFDNRRVHLETFSIRGGEGRFSASGEAGVEGGKPRLELEWSAEKLTAVQHPDLRLVVTGSGKATVGDGQGSLRGTLTVDQGRVELRSNTAPALGEDVVIEGRKQRTAFTARELRPEVDLTLDLGRNFVVRGRGLDATLVGSVRLTSAGNAPLQAKGEIGVARGTYEAYGQRLSIDEGKLYFSGPIDNPGLSIRAMRKNQAVEAGVAVTGTARDPEVALVSNPQVPDAEKLSWLVLGRPVEATGTADAEKLQAAAVALAAGLGTGPLQQQLAHAVGLDEIRFAPAAGNGKSGTVAVGKRISDRIYFTYEQSLSTASNLFRVSYQLTRNWSLRTESGAAQALDLFYTISFD